MRKFMLTLVLSVGVFAIGGACELAEQYWAWEAANFGFESLDEMEAAYNAWVEVAC